LIWLTFDVFDSNDNTGRKSITVGLCVGPLNQRDSLSYFSLPGLLQASDAALSPVARFTDHVSEEIPALMPG